MSPIPAQRNTTPDTRFLIDFPVTTQTQNTQSFYLHAANEEDGNNQTNVKSQQCYGRSSSMLYLGWVDGMGWDGCDWLS